MPLLYYLPKVAISSIVIVAASRLIEFDWVFQYKIGAYREIFLSLLCFGGTFFLGPELGILIAIGASLYLVVRHTTLPNVAVLGRTPRGHWKDIASFPSARVVPVCRSWLLLFRSDI